MVEADDADDEALFRLTGAEVAAASATSALSAAILVSYAVYSSGHRVAPLLVLAASIATGIATALRLRRRARLNALHIGAFAAVITAVAGVLVWLAWPGRLPPGGGPDLTHHMVLINFIEREWRLMRIPALFPYLGDMLDYTPGSHLLIAMTGAWTGTDGLHAVYPVIVAVVALKAGVIFCLAARVLARGRAAIPLALVAVLLLFVPYEYFIGSFAHDSYWAQVVAELFACAAWWTLVVWDDSPSLDAMWLFAMFGAATFVTWPIWIGPIVLAATVLVLRDGRLAGRAKTAHLSAALVPIATVATYHSITRLYRLQMAGTSGAVTLPSVGAFGWPFLALAAAGALLLIPARRGRSTVLLVGAIAVQAVALWLVARASGAQAPYLALKMLYLLVYPLAVAGAYAMAMLWNAAVRSRKYDAFVWIVIGAVAVVAARRVATSPRPKPIVTESVYAAGRWARDHVPRACVDYLVADGYTGYWLHLAVLDNPRDTARMNDPDTFEPDKAVRRWFEADGLPFAIVDDLNGFSRALFTSTDTIAQFDRSAVIKRRGQSTCSE